MKLKGSKQVHYDSGPNMTPLVDVVMVILIFLMLAGKFEDAEHFMEPKLPVAENAPGEVTDKPFIPKTIVSIDVRPDPRDPEQIKFIASTVTATGTLASGDPEVLREGLSRLRDGIKGQGKSDDEIQVLIRPSRSLSYDALIKVYEAANRAEFTNVSFTTAG